MNEGINLASARLGAEAVACSDEFFAAMSRLIDDSEPVFCPDRFDDHGHWMDGWETRRRRSGGFDWCVVRLAAPGRLLRFELDTRYFTGNYPPGATPDVAGVRVFRARGGEGVNYRAGTWHHPLLVDRPQRFLVIDRGGEGANLEEVSLATPVRWLRG